MAKKVKKKPKSGQKDKRGPSTTPKTVSAHDTSISESPNNGVAGVVDTRICSHIDKGINMDKLSVKIGTSESFICEDCRGQITDTRSKKGKGGKHGKKVGTISKSKSKAIWICLECGHFSCGGLGFPTTPQSHAVRHAKQNHHPLAVHYKNHYLVWCFLCDKIIPVEKSEDGKHKETFKEVLKMLKRKPGEGSNLNVEDVWFGSGSVTSAVKSSDYQISVPDVKVGYSIRGLVNLGNTCFFNSVMQNLLPIHSLREYLFELDESVGPLIASLRKFFLETNSEAGFKGAINPRPLFGSLCTKAPQFRGYQQHDSHELLRCLLNDLSTEELSARKRNESSITGPTFVDTIFGGQLSSTVSCLECGHSSTLYEPFLDLSLPVPTKKPPARRQETKTAVFGPVARGKKPKPPPKRPGRNYSKLSREANNRPRKSTSAQSTDDNILGNLQTIPQPLEQGVLSPGDYALSDFIDPNDIALDMGFTVENLSSLDDLSTEELSARKRNESSITGPTFVDTIFRGQLSSTVSCLECGHSSTLYEPFLDLSLPVPTKKPPARRQETKTAVFGPVARGKKPKPPPKRPGRNYSKLSRVANNRPRESTSAQSTDDNILGKLQTIPQPLEQGVLFPGDYALSDFIDPNDIALDMGFTVENLSSLDDLSTEELSARKRNESSITGPTFVDTIFGGQLSSTVSCLECGHSSALYEPFLDLSLPVPTKKPPARRQETKTAVFGPVARGKKPKPPPKRPGRNYSKLSREANNRPRESTSAQSTDDNILGKLQTIPQPLEQGVLSPGDYALSDFIDPNDIALDMGFTVENLSSVQNPNNEQTVENVGEQSISSDNFAWLDYLLPENDIAKESDEISAIQGLSNENALQNDVSLSITRDSKDESSLETAFSATSVDNVEHFNASSIGPLTRDLDALSPFEDKQNGNSQSSEVVQNDADIGHNFESNTSGKVNENPSQIQDSQVILLPSKEMAVSSSSVPGDEQDSLDFGGFGDLFNEPEPEVPFGPVSEANTENGVINNSESDPDEVDNSDAPVSVESCLALFTTPELLFKDEHAWKCDNCSKVMRERKIRSRSKLQLLISEAVQNGCAENITGPSEEIHENGDFTRLQNHPKTVIYASELLSENTEPLKLDACASLNNEDVNPRELDKNGFAECDLLSAEHESDSELTNEKVDEVNLEKLKVKRDAAKTMLITKVPSVLTIQLKRFSHDARGRLSKLNGHVNFRETIDLKPYMDPRCSEGDSFRYRLVGLVEHLGSMRGGHYVAYVRGSKEYGDCVWYHASDAYVRQASLEEVMRSQAYILFYEKI